MKPIGFGYLLLQRIHEDRWEWLPRQEKVDFHKECNKKLQTAVGNGKQVLDNAEMSEGKNSM